MNVPVEIALRYLEAYILEYRKKYALYIASPPTGGGYPALNISSYLNSARLTCWLALDGAILIDESSPPEDEWWLPINSEKYGGLIIDRVDEASDINSIEVKNGQFSRIIETREIEVDGTSLVVNQILYNLCETFQRITFGVFALPPQFQINFPFWVPSIVSNLAFMTADRQSRRFVNYLEILPHIDIAAWDVRSLYTRVQADIRRDFARAITQPQSGGTFSFGDPFEWIVPFYDRINILGDSIQAFRKLLEEQGDAPESVFHAFLLENPILLDVYATEVISKPRFYYPENESPLGKEYVEPDLILKYSNGHYKLIELERPSKQVSTIKGHPTADFTQPNFQIAEWRAYIQAHNDLIKSQFPGISNNKSAMVVISRTTQANFPNVKNMQAYKGVLKNMYPYAEIYTYDDLLEEANAMYIRLLSLQPA